MESILKFISVEKFEKDTFSVKCQMDDISDKLEDWSWVRIVAEKKQYKITGYNISIIEVELEEDGSLRTTRIGRKKIFLLNFYLEFLKKKIL